MACSHNICSLFVFNQRTKDGQKLTRALVELNSGELNFCVYPTTNKTQKKAKTGDL